MTVRTARIRIEDLSPLKNLTEQEMAEIYGAGRKGKWTFSGQAMEVLEVRQVMSAITVAIDGSTAKVTGSVASDAVFVRQESGRAYIETGSEHGLSRTELPDSVRQLQFDLGAGDDFVQIADAFWESGLTIDSGEGADVLVAGSGITSNHLTTAAIDQLFEVGTQQVEGVSNSLVRKDVDGNKLELTYRAGQLVAAVTTSTTGTVSKISWSIDGSVSRQTYDGQSPQLEELWTAGGGYRRTDWNSEGSVVTRSFLNESLLQEETWQANTFTRTTWSGDGSRLQQRFQNDALIREELATKSGETIVTEHRSDGSVVRESYLHGKLRLSDVVTTENRVRTAYAENGAVIRQSFVRDQQTLEETWTTEGGFRRTTFIAAGQSVTEFFKNDQLVQKDEVTGTTLTRTAWNASGASLRQVYQKEVLVSEEQWGTNGSYSRKSWNSDGSSVRDTYENGVVRLREEWKGTTAVRTGWGADGSVLRQTWVNGRQTTEEAWDTQKGVRKTTWNSDDSILRQTWQDGKERLREEWQSGKRFTRIGWSETGESYRERFVDGKQLSKEQWNTNGGYQITEWNATETKRSTYQNDVQRLRETWAGKSFIRESWDGAGNSMKESHWDGKITTRQQWAKDGSSIRNTYSTTGTQTREEKWGSDSSYQVTNWYSTSTWRQTYSGGTEVLREVWEGKTSTRQVWDGKGNSGKQTWDNGKQTRDEKWVTGGIHQVTNWYSSSTERQTFISGKERLRETWEGSTYTKIGWDGNGNSIRQIWTNGKQTSEGIWDESGGYRRTTWYADNSVWRQYFLNGKETYRQTWSASGAYKEHTWTVPAGFGLYGGSLSPKSIKSAMDSVGSKASSAVSTVITTASNVTSTAASTVASAISSKITVLKDVAATIDASIKGINTGALEQLGKIGQNWQSFDKLFDTKFGAIDFGKWGDAIKFDASSFKDFGKWANDSFTKIQSFDEQFRDLHKQNFTNLNQYAEARWEAFADYSGDRLESLGDYMGDRWEAFADYSTDRINSGTDYMGDRWKAVSDYSSDRWEALAKASVSTWHDTLGKLDAGWMKFEDNFRDYTVRQITQISVEPSDGQYRIAIELNKSGAQPTSIEWRVTFNGEIVHSEETGLQNSIVFSALDNGRYTIQVDLKDKKNRIDEFASAAAHVDLPVSEKTVIFGETDSPVDDNTGDGSGTSDSELAYAISEEEQNRGFALPYLVGSSGMFVDASGKPRLGVGLLEVGEEASVYANYKRVNANGEPVDSGGRTNSEFDNWKQNELARLNTTVAGFEAWRSALWSYMNKTSLKAGDAYGGYVLFWKAFHANEHQKNGYGSSIYGTDLKSREEWEREIEDRWGEDGGSELNWPNWYRENFPGETVSQYFDARYAGFRYQQLMDNERWQADDAWVSATGSEQIEQGLAVPAKITSSGQWTLQITTREKDGIGQQGSKPEVINFPDRLTAQYFSTVSAGKATVEKWKQFRASYVAPSVQQTSNSLKGVIKSGEYDFSYFANRFDVNKFKADLEAGEQDFRDAFGIVPFWGVFADAGNVYVYAKQGKIKEAAVSGAGMLLSVLPLGRIAKGISGKIGDLVSFGGKEVIQLDKEFLKDGADNVARTFKEGINEFATANLGQIVKKSGLSADAARYLQKVAADHDVLLAVRPRSEGSFKKVYVYGTHHPKPEILKMKTIKDADQKLGVNAQVDEIALYNPQETLLKKYPEIKSAQDIPDWLEGTGKFKEKGPAPKDVQEAYSHRFEEWNAYDIERGEMLSAQGMRDADGTIYRMDAKTGVVTGTTSDGVTKKIAGDSDLYAILDKATGKPLQEVSTVKYYSVLESLKISPAQAMHGDHLHWKVKPQHESMRTAIDKGHMSPAAGGTSNAERLAVFDGSSFSMKYVDEIDGLLTYVLNRSTWLK